jgi:hypothetical protein
LITRGTQIRRNGLTSQRMMKMKKIQIRHATTFTQGSKYRTCYCCGKIGHLSPECPDKNTTKKEDWHTKKAAQYYIWK